MSNPVPKYTGLILLALVACLLSACTSAEGLMEDGAKLEAEGRYEEALRKYIAAYDKDPTIVDLDAQITELGNRVVADLLQVAAQADSDGQAVLAAETFLRVDDIVLRAFNAGLALDRPVDYAERRDRALRSAVDTLLEEGRRQYEAGNLGGADSAFREALDRFGPNAVETEQLLQGRYAVLLGLTDQATASGRFRDATARADEALAIAETLGIPPDEAMALRARALDLGTLYVVPAPVTTPDRGRDGVSPWILAEVNDRLELDFWSNPPEFVAMAHGALVRQRVRGLGFGRRPLTKRDARILANDLGAHLVVATEVERFDLTETEEEIRPRKTKTRSGGEAYYDEIRGRAQFDAVVRLFIVARDGSVVYDDQIDRRVRRDFRRAEFDGDWTDLRLSSSERKLFSDEHYESFLADVESELVDEVTARVADQAFNRITREVR